MKTKRSLVSALCLLPFLAARANAQVTVNFTNPPAGNVFAAGGDYATDVLGDPWDMNSQNDVSVDPLEKQYWSGACGARCVDLVNDGATAPTTVRGTWSGTEGMYFLYRGHYAVINSVRNGRAFPIASNLYRKISFRMKSPAGFGPAVYWFHRPLGDPGGQGVGEAWNFGGSVGTGYQIYTIDLGGSFPNCGPQPCAGDEAWAAANVVGLRIDPKLGGANAVVSFDWVRLTAADNAPGSAMQTINWSGGSGNATITISDASGPIYTVASGVGATSFTWNYGILPPGSYTVTVQRTSGSGTKNFTINAPPLVQITSPSMTSGQDYSTAAGNAWDMHDAADIDNDIVADHLISRNFPGTEFVGVSDGQCVSGCGTIQPSGDPQVYTLANNETNNRGTIDSTKYRYLTFNLQVDRAYDLFLGSVGRVMWGHAAAFDFGRGISPSYNVAVSEDMIVWPGPHTYTIDLGSLGIGTDLGILPSPYSPTPTTWASASVRQLRIDPHEFAEQIQFHMSDVKLTAKSEVAPGGTFAINFVASDPNADALSVQLFRDTDKVPGGEVAISGVLTGAAVTSGTFSWNTTGVPIGDYYISAQISDGIHTRSYYSNAPVAVKTPSAGPPNPAMALDSPAPGSTTGTSFNVTGWAIDRGAVVGTGIDAVHVYAYPAGGGGGIFLGAASYGGSRPDIGGIFGSQFTNSGFSLSASGLANGGYQITAYGHSTITGTFNVASSVSITVSGPVSNPAMTLDSPSNNGTSGKTVTITGWAIDRGAPSGTGVDTVHVWAFPSGGGAATFLGAATYGLSRPDIGTAFGSQFTNSGFRLAVVVPAGNYTINAYMHSTVANAFNAAVGAVNVTVNTTDSNAVVYVDTPAQNAVKMRPFPISGWAVDSGAPTGTGIDAIHVWAFPTNGAPSFFVGVASYGSARPDIGSLYGDSRFTNSGLSLTVNNGNVPSPGTYDFYVFGHSTVTGGFTVARIVRVTVQ